MIAIVGAGAIGCLWASSFEANKVTFLSTRQNDPESISFTFKDAQDSTRPNKKVQEHFTFAQHHVNQTAQNELTPSCLWICTKSTAALEACIELNKHLPSSVPFVLLQNGLGSQKATLKMLSNRPIYAAVTTHGANMPRDNTLVHAGHGSTFVGALNKQAANANELTALRLALSDSAFEIQYSADIWQALWQKLIINCSINPFTALLNVRNGDIAKHALFQELWPPLRSELENLSNIAGYPLTESKIEDSVFSVMRSTQDNISSMLQDIRAGRRTEIDDINGYACKALEAANMNKHANQQLWERVNALGN